MSKQFKDRTDAAIDDIVSAEIPDPETDPQYYQCVQDSMMHGPCGVADLKSSCMSDGICVKKFPKPFVDITSRDSSGYPIYRRRNNGRFVVKRGFPLDNRYVIPHNRHLLLRYGAHVNVEWCNQSRAIKYLFKYINKGNDRVTAAFSREDGLGSHKVEDEVTQYYDCRYISPCEAAWRIFSFEIHFRYPPVERLGFHLPGEQSVVFSEEAQIDEVLARPSVKQTMFLEWMEANKKFPEARCLTYAQFPTKFVFNRNKWQPRQSQFAIGRLYNVKPGSGELYYLRCLLNIVKGPTSYEEIRCISGVQYDTFRDAMYSLGLLDDDKEYIDAIKEASLWASAYSMRYMFASLLCTSSISRPEVVWEECWTYLCDDIEEKHRNLFHHRGKNQRIIIVFPFELLFLS